MHRRQRSFGRWSARGYRSPARRPSPPVSAPHEPRAHGIQVTRLVINWHACQEPPILKKQRGFTRTLFTWRLHAWLRTHEHPPAPLLAPKEHAQGRHPALRSQRQSFSLSASLLQWRTRRLSCAMSEIAVADYTVRRSATHACVSRP